MLMGIVLLIVIVCGMFLMILKECKYDEYLEDREQEEYLRNYQVRAENQKKKLHKRQVKEL